MEARSVRQPKRIWWIVILIVVLTGGAGLLGHHHSALGELAAACGEPPAIELACPEPVCPEPPETACASPCPDVTCPPPVIEIVQDGPACEPATPCSPCPEAPACPDLEMPRVVMGLQDDFATCVAYFWDGEELIEADRLDLREYIQFEDEEPGEISEQIFSPSRKPWTLRAGVVLGREFDRLPLDYDKPRIRGLALGLSRAFGSRWGGYAHARWVSDPESVLLWPTRDQHYSQGPEISYYEEARWTADFGLEWSF